MQLQNHGGKQHSEQQTAKNFALGTLYGDPNPYFKASSVKFSAFLDANLCINVFNNCQKYIAERIETILVSRQ